jgi:hypothetical protein
MNKKIIQLLLILFNACILQHGIASAGAKKSINFLVEDRVMDFKQTIRGVTCKGRIHYPYLSHEDPEALMEINEDIHDFAEIYSFCNTDRKYNYSVEYKLLESYNSKYFSVIWTTKKNGKAWRLDALTFDKLQDEAIKMSELVNGFVGSMMDEIVKISDGHVEYHSSWHDFLNMIEKRDVQFYLENGEWMLVFNPTPKADSLVITKMPKFFLKGEDVKD